MTKNRSVRGNPNRQTPGIKHSNSLVHTHILPVFLSVLFLLSLLIYRKLAFPDISQGDIAVPDIPNAQEPVDEKLTVKDEAETSVILKAQMEYQYPELPNGCEATSLSIALNILGYPADKQSIAYDYLPSQPFTSENGIYYAPDPDVMYAGDPATSLGFYCFEYPVTVAADQFFYALKVPWTAQTLDRVSGDAIDAALRAGSPVIVWATIDYSDAAQYHSDFRWILSNGETYTPYSNLHCVVVYGFSSDTYYVCDPIEGQLEIDKSTLLLSAAALGNHAVYFQNITQ